MKNRSLIGFLIIWGLFMLAAQVPLIILYTAIGFNGIVVAGTEAAAGIVCAMVSAIMIVQEDY